MANRYATSVLAGWVAVLLLMGSGPAYALPVAATTGPNDQIKLLNDLGGTVFQVGGAGAGKQLLKSADFVGSPTNLTGVHVAQLPGFLWASEILNQGSFPTDSEPGNTALHLLSGPTDLTFTSPGPGGPDGNGGDGSIQFLAGNYVVLGFGGPRTIGGGSSDFIVFTNTAGGGQARFEFLDDAASVVASYAGTLAGATAGSGWGGLVLDFNQEFSFSALRITGLSGSVEIDAVAAAAVPEPATLLLVGSGIAGLAGVNWRRRRPR